MAYNEDSSASGHDEPWIQWFCGLKGHEMFCEVERSYIEDGFNLYGLRACVQNFSDCLDLILDRIGPDDSDDSHLTQSACTLYGLIHARYIITAHGLDAMYNKYAAKEFGTCPLVQCAGQPVLPLGLRDEMGQDTVKIFCPKCQCVYHPPPVRSRSSHHASIGSGGSGGVDGASFGTTFPHLFLMTFSNLVPNPLPTDSAYVPRVFGFRVHQSARQRNSSVPPVQSASAARRSNNRGKSALAPAPGPSAPPLDASLLRDAESGVKGSSTNAKKASAMGTKKSASGSRTGERGGNVDGDDEKKQTPSSAKRSKPDADSGKSASAGDSKNENGLTENKMKRPKRQNVT